MFYKNISLDFGSFEQMSTEATEPSARNYKYMVVSYQEPLFSDSNGDYDTWGPAFETERDAELCAKGLAKEYPSTEFFVSRLQLSVKQAEPRFIVDLV